MQLGAGKPLTGLRWWQSAFLLIALANLPDIDFLPGYLVGDPVRYHWGPAHSFGAAVLAGVLIGGLARWRGGRFNVAFILATTAYAAHVATDMLLGPGALRTGGLQAFWPLSAERFMAPWSVFLLFPSSIDQIGPIRALFSSDIFPLMAREVLVLGPVCLAAWSLRVLSAGKVGPLTAVEPRDATPR